MVPLTVTALESTSELFRLSRGLDGPKESNGESKRFSVGSGVDWRTHTRSNSCD